MIKTEFKVLGRTMEQMTIYYGIFLIVWAIFATLAGQSASVTSMIPAFFGLPIAINGFLAIRIPSKKKLIMHIVVLLGLTVFLGGLDFLRGLDAENGPFSNPWAALSKLMMLFTGAGFCWLCIKSFICARKMQGELK